MENEYLKGWKNGLIRIYYYLLQGVNTVSDFRNVILGIFGLYITLKLANPWFMVMMFVGAIIILIPLGYFKVHKISRVQEWLQTKYGSHYAVKNFDYVEATYKELVEIRKELYNLTTNNKHMPLGKNVSKNIRELIADNKKKGKAKGAGGKVRPRKQIIAIALSAAKVPMKMKKKMGFKK